MNSELAHEYEVKAYSAALRVRGTRIVYLEHLDATEHEPGCDSFFLGTVAASALTKEGLTWIRFDDDGKTCSREAKLVDYYTKWMFVSKKPLMQVMGE